MVIGQGFSKNKLFCFSPPVMVATFVIEVLMATYTLVRYKLDALGRLVLLGLLCLGTFQLAEYFVCGGLGGSARTWAKIGYVAITALPPLGLHIMFTLAGKKNRWVTGLVYATMLGFMGYFLVISNAIRGQECTGNYVIFQLGERASSIYGLYYYGLLMFAIGLGMRWIGHLNGSKDKKSKIMRKTMTALILGYLAFLLPTAVMNSIDPSI